MSNSTLTPTGWGESVTFRILNLKLRYCSRLWGRLSQGYGRYELLYLRILNRQKSFNAENTVILRLLTYFKVSPGRDRHWDTILVVGNETKHQRSVHTSCGWWCMRRNGPHPVLLDVLQDVCTHCEQCRELCIRICIIVGKTPSLRHPSIVDYCRVCTRCLARSERVDSDHFRLKIDKTRYGWSIIEGYPKIRPSAILL